MSIGIALPTFDFLLRADVDDEEDEAEVDGVGARGDIPDDDGQAHSPPPPLR